MEEMKIKDKKIETYCNGSSPQPATFKLSKFFSSNLKSHFWNQPSESLPPSTRGERVFKVEVEVLLVIFMI